MFYTGTRFAEWKGNALIGGLSSEALIRLTLKGNGVDDGRAHRRCVAASATSSRRPTGPCWS